MKNYLLHLYTIYKLISASSRPRFHFPSNVLGLKCWPNATELDANYVNFVYYGKTRMFKQNLFLYGKITLQWYLTHNKNKIFLNTLKLSDREKGHRLKGTREKKQLCVWPTQRCSICIWHYNNKYLRFTIPRCRLCPLRIGCETALEGSVILYCMNEWTTVDVFDKVTFTIIKKWKDWPGWNKSGHLLTLKY